MFRLGSSDSGVEQKHLPHWSFPELKGETQEQMVELKSVGRWVTKKAPRTGFRSHWPHCTASIAPLSIR